MPKKDLLNFTDDMVSSMEEKRKSGLNFIEEVRITDYGCILIFCHPINYVAGLRLKTRDQAVIQALDYALYILDQAHIEKDIILSELYNIQGAIPDTMGYIEDKFQEQVLTRLSRIIFSIDVCGIFHFDENYGNIKFC